MDDTGKFVMVVTHCRSGRSWLLLTAFALAVAPSVRGDTFSGSKHPMSVNGAGLQGAGAWSVAQADTTDPSAEVENAARAAADAEAAAEEAARAAKRAADAARRAVEALRRIGRTGGGGTADGDRKRGTSAKTETAPIVLCAPGDGDGSCTHTSLSAALRAARDGATVTIRPGLYRQGGVVTANNVTIQAEGAHLRGAAVLGKAALVVRGRNTTIVGLECSAVGVPDGNGACVRIEATGLRLRDVHFHDNQMGVLGGGQQSGDVLIEDSTIEKNGIPGGNLGHNVYVDGTSLTIRRSRILSARNRGHQVKSRAAKTVIEDSVIAALKGLNSRLVDVPNGGEVVIRNSVLEAGPRTENTELIGFGLERGRPSGVDHPINRLTVTGNTVLVDRGFTSWLRSRDLDSLTIRDNTVIGPMNDEGHGSRQFPNRDAAGYPPFPALTK